MSLKLYEARSEINGVINDQWADFTPTNGCEKPRLYFDDVAYEDDDDATGSEPVNPPDNDTSWIRVNIRPLSGYQASLGAAGSYRAFRRNLLIVLRVHTPFGDGMEENDRICESLIDAFDGKHTASSVWFRNFGFQHVGKDGPWSVQNTSGEARYDDIKR